MRDANIPQAEVEIQQRRPRLSVGQVLLLVPTEDYGRAGCRPADDDDCGYYQKYGVSTTCIADGSLCVGFRGTTRDRHTLCGWLPRWTQPGQTVVVVPEDTTDPASGEARWN